MRYNRLSENYIFHRFARDNWAAENSKLVVEFIDVKTGQFLALRFDYLDLNRIEFLEQNTQESFWQAHNHYVARKEFAEVFTKFLAELPVTHECLKQGILTQIAKKQIASIAFEGTDASTDCETLHQFSILVKDRDHAAKFYLTNSDLQLLQEKIKANASCYPANSIAQILGAPLETSQLRQLSLHSP